MYREKLVKIRTGCYGVAVCGTRLVDHLMEDPPVYLDTLDVRWLSFLRSCRHLIFDVQLDMVVGCTLMIPHVPDSRPRALLPVLLSASAKSIGDFQN